MEKTLKFTDNGKEYTLKFTRETIIATENMGFNLANVVDKPISSLILLWRGAFLANHDTLTIAEVDAIFDKISKDQLLDALLDLYNAPIESLFDEENSKNAIKWTVT
mgnify:CR=1 FL=1